MLELKFYHPYRMLLCAFFVFLLGRIFIDILGYGDFAKNFLFYEGRVIGRYLQFRTLICLMLFLCLMHLGVILALKKNSGIKLISWTHNLNMERFGKFLFWSFLIPSIYYYYIFISFTLENGYANKLYGDDVIDANILIKLSDDILKIGYLLLLASKPSIKSLKYPTILYLVIMFSTLLTGNRVYFFTTVLMIMTYFGYRNMLSKKVTLIIGSTLLVLAVLVGVYRTFNDFSFVGNYEYDNFFVSFFRDQGISIHTVSLTIDMIDQGILTYDFRYLYMPLLGLLYQSDVVLERFYLADSEAFLYDSSYYSLGGGFGSSIVSEFYAYCGIIGVIFGSLICGFLLIKSVNLLFRNNWSVYGMLLMLPMLYYTPRSYPLIPIITSIKPLILTIFLFILFDFFYIKRKIRNK